MRWGFIRQGRGTDFGFVQMILDLLKICVVVRIAGWMRTSKLILRLHLHGDDSVWATKNEIKLPIKIAKRNIDMTLRDNQSDVYTFAEIFLRNTYGTLPSERLEEIKTVIDIGAHIGFASVYFALNMPNARVISVEPVSENIALLRRNTLSLGTQLSVISAAVAGHKGITEMTVSDWFSSSTIMPKVRSARFDDANRAEGQLPKVTRSVRTVTIPWIMASENIERINLLKIDAEGAEDVIFTTDSNWLNSVDWLQLDLHEKYVDSTRIRYLLCKFGFNLHVNDKNRAFLFRNSNSFAWSK